MNKNNADKVIVVRIPTILFDQFKESCNKEFKTMSETIRDFIREYIKENNDTNK